MVRKHKKQSRENPAALQRLHDIFTQKERKEGGAGGIIRPDSRRACLYRPIHRFPAGPISVMRRTAPCFPVKATAPIITSAVTNSASAGRNTSSTSRPSGPLKAPICASTGSCAAPSPDNCGRIRPGIPCAEKENRSIWI